MIAPVVRLSIGIARLFQDVSSGSENGFVGRPACRSMRRGRPSARRTRQRSNRWSNGHGSGLSAGKAQVSSRAGRREARATNGVSQPYSAGMTPLPTRKREVCSRVAGNGMRGRWLARVRPAKWQLKEAAN